MAKRKRKPGSVTAFKFKPQVDYRSDEYLMHLVSIETGIMQASVIEETITDGDVDRMLEHLVRRLKDPEQLTRLLADHSKQAGKEIFDDVDDVIDVDDDAPDRQAILLHFVFANLSRAFDEHGPLEAKDIIGIAKVIRSSINTWNVGMHRRGYLTYIEGFLGEVGISTRKLTEEEARAMGLTDLFPEDE